MNYSAKVVVAAHKEYRMPTDKLYMPLHVGAEGKFDCDGKPMDIGFTKDNTGENISYLNSSFCELTGLYWAWKNLEADYLGMVHYRRHFSLKNKKGFENILSEEELMPFLGDKKIFVPKKRRYYIETLYSHYAHTHYIEHLDRIREIISKKYPEYVKSYDTAVNRTYGYMFNMFIMEKGLLNDYCDWLFSILFELEKVVDYSIYDDFQKRLFGRVSEILFNVWLNYQLENGTISKDEVKEIPCIHMEKINWFKKGTGFLKAKFRGKKYIKSA